MAEYIENQMIEINNDNYKEPVHSLLDQDCQHYIEAGVKAQDKLFKSFHQYKKFLSHWYYCIQRRPGSHEAMHFAFKYFETSAAEEIRNLAETFLQELRRCYVRKDKSVVQFVKNFPKDSRQLILTNDIDWSITGKEEYAIIADEFCFAWSVARLWQLLESRKQEYLIKGFLFLCKNEELSFSGERDPAKHDEIPEELCSALKEIVPRDEAFFKRTKYFFDPEYLTNEEMANYLKIACVSAVFGKPPSETSRKPLDNIWLLARFYGIHFYSYGFIFGKKRGLSDRFLKQIETLQNPAILEDFNVSILEKMKQKTIKWGKKLLSYTEMLASIKDKSFLDKLKEKSKKIIHGKERDPYEPVSNAWEGMKSKDSILDKIDFSDPKFSSLLKKNPKAFNTFYMWLAFINEMESSTNEEDLDEDFEGENLEEEDSEYAGFVVAEFVVKTRWFLEHEKNLSLITNDDIDLGVLTVLITVWAILKLFQAQKDNLKK